MQKKLMRPGRAECIAFLHQLIMYLSNGQSLCQTLQTCDHLFKGKKEFMFVTRLYQSIAEGHTWATSIQSTFDYQSTLYDLSRAQSKIGLLKSANHILRSIKRQSNLIQSLTALVMYPLLVCIGLIATLIVYQMLIKPQFYSYLPEEANWLGTVLPLAAGSVLLLFLIGAVYVVLNPLKKGWLPATMRILPVVKRLCNLRIWESLLIFLDIRMAGGATLWDTLSSAQKVYGSTNEGQQLARIKQSLFAGGDLQLAVLRNHHIPDCIETIFYSSLQCNNLEGQLVPMQEIVSWQLDQSIKKLTTIVEPAAIVLCGWAVLGLCMDILLPIHRFLSGGII